MHGPRAGCLARDRDPRVPGVRSQEDRGCPGGRARTALAESGSLGASLCRRSPPAILVRSPPPVGLGARRRPGYGRLVGGVAALGRSGPLARY